jgi:hypothetical protein
MRHDPHFPTLEQITHSDPFELVDTPWGTMEAWRASTIATGTMGALAQLHAIVRNDQAELEEQTAKLDAKKHQVLRTVNRLLSFMSRVDALTAHVSKLWKQSAVPTKNNNVTSRKSPSTSLLTLPSISRHRLRLP